MTLLRLSLLALLPALLVIAGAALLISWEVASTRSAGMRQAGEAGATAQAGVVTGHVLALELQAELLASDPVAAAALAARDEAAIAAAADALKARLPGTLRVDLFPTGAQPTPDSGKPALGYAAIDLLARAAAGQQPPLEVHMFGTPNQQLVLVRPVKAAGKQIGSVLFSFDPAMFKRWLRPPAEGAGYVELNQTGSDQVFASAGDTGLKGGDAFTAAVAATALRIRFWPAPADGDMTGLMAIFAVTALLVGAIVVGFGWITQGIVSNDLANLIRSTLSRKEPARLQPLRLEEFRRVAAEVERKRDSGSSSMLNKPDPATGGLPDSDLVFMPKDALKVEEVDMPEGREPRKPQ